MTAIAEPPLDLSRPNTQRSAAPVGGRFASPHRCHQVILNRCTCTTSAIFSNDCFTAGSRLFETWQELSAYAREHTHKPPGVARRLNADGHRTASGAMWTPRLVRFLLALMFNDFGSRKQAGTPTAKQPLHQTCSTSAHAGRFKPPGSIRSLASRLPVSADVTIPLSRIITDHPRPT